MRRIAELVLVSLVGRTCISQTAEHCGEWQIAFDIKAGAILGGGSAQGAHLQGCHPLQQPPPPWVASPSDLMLCAAVACLSREEEGVSQCCYLLQISGGGQVGIVAQLTSSLAPGALDSPCPPQVRQLHQSGFQEQVQA